MVLRYIDLIVNTWRRGTSVFRKMQKFYYILMNVT